MHDTLKVVVRKARVHITGSIVRRTGVGGACTLILRPPAVWNVLPVDQQVWPMSMVTPSCIWSLLLVVHAKSMTNFVHQVPLVPQRVAPSQVHLRWNGRGPAHARQVTAPRVVHPHADVVGRAGACRELDEADACVAPPLLRGRAEGLPPGSVHARVEPVVHEHALRPAARARRRPRPDAPGAHAGAAVAWPAVPGEARRSPDRIALQVASPAQASLQLAVLLGSRADHLPAHDAVGVFLVVLFEVPVPRRNTPALVVPRVSVDHEGAHADQCRIIDGLQGTRHEHKPRPLRPWR
mmetsp:Transcript_2826/g.8398  ORF Transcript_2826/g.8398 Transcript_2826/m.8398 type:complete len:295 (-) Transcript_2826:415-1299(-)